MSNRKHRVQPLCKTITSYFRNVPITVEHFLQWRNGVSHVYFIFPACSVRFKYCGRECTVHPHSVTLCFVLIPPTPLHPIIPDTSLYTVPRRAVRSSANQWPDQQWTMTSALVVPLKLFVFFPSALDDGTIVWTGMFQGPSRDEAYSFISPFYGVVIYGQSTLFENGLLYFYLFEWTPNH